jgi:hypothetical protein
MRRLLACTGFVALVSGFIATPSASAQQSVTWFIGGFVPRGFESRDPNDVLVHNLLLEHPLVFEVGDFHNITVGGEYLVALGHNLEAGLGVSFYQKSVPTINRDLTFTNGDEIQSLLKLRTVPINATVRFLPLGRRAPVQPYVGGGVAVINWHYSESGDFVASDGVTIVRGTFEGSGTDVGPLVLGGVRFPIGAVDLGGEIRYQWATGALPPDQDFAGSVIDLGGLNYLFTLNIRF